MRLAGGVARQADPTDPCTCNCCIAQREVQVGHLACGPLVPGASDESQCGSLCTVPAEAIDTFNSLSDEVDSIRFCLLACRPMQAEPGQPCEPGAEPGATDAADGHGAQGLSAIRQLAQVGRHLNEATSDAPASSAVLQLARGQMKQAMRHAEAAGEAARTAREAYERALAVSKAMAAAAGQATVDEIKKEAGLQAAEALKVRQQYELFAREHATKAAIEAAVAYKSAKVRDLAIGRAWAHRAEQLRAASKERREWASRTKAAGKLDQAEEAEQEASALAKSAEAARQRAEAAEESAQSSDEEVAATAAMARALPADVAPPQLP